MFYNFFSEAKSICFSLNIALLFSQSLNPGLDMVVTIAEHASYVAPKRILRLSVHRLQIFLVTYECLQSLQQCEDQGIREKFKKRVCNHMIAILTTYMETRYKAFIKH